MGRKRMNYEPEELGPDELEPSADEPSRSARKRESHERKRLGEALIELKPERLAALDLPEPLVEAIAEARRLTSHGARRRQAQFVGKLMRRLDDETLAAIREMLER